MGIERARVVEVHAPAGAVGSGYVVTDRLVLTAARNEGTAHVRPVGMGTWVPSSVVWRSAGVAVLELDDPSALMLSSERVPFGRVRGTRPLAVTAMGFPPSPTRPTWPRDPLQVLGHVTPGDPLAVTVNGVAGEGMCGAALFAGAELVGVLLDSRCAAPVAAMAEEPAFVDLFGGVELADVSTPAFGLPIL